MSISYLNQVNDFIAIVMRQGLVEMCEEVRGRCLWCVCPAHTLHMPCIHTHAPMDSRVAIYSPSLYVFALVAPSIFDNNIYIYFF